MPNNSLKALSCQLRVSLFLSPLPSNLRNGKIPFRAKSYCMAESAQNKKHEKGTFYAFFPSPKRE